MPEDLRQLGTPIETKDGAQSKVDSHENSTSGVHGVGGSDVASTADVAEKADDPHGNDAHSETFAVDGDAQPPENHGNDAHLEDYIDTLEDSDWRLTTEDGDAVMEHKQTDATIIYDETDNAWIPSTQVGTADNKVTGTSYFESVSVDSPLQNNSGTYFEGVSTDGTVSGATDIDLTTANLFRHTVTGDVDYSFSGASTEVDGASFTLLIEMSGTNTITWPTSVEWDGGEAPDSPADGEQLEISFISYDGGTTWKGRESWGTE